MSDDFTVRKISSYIPMSDEMLGLTPPTTVPWRRRLKWRIYDRWWAMRRAVGYWIAGDRGGWEDA